jgi:hypothetical protein
MTLDTQIALALKVPDTFDKVHKNIIIITDNFAIGFTQWKDSNYLMYKDGTYYIKTSSKYFDITKYIGKEKPTNYYTLEQLLQIYKEEKGL